MSKAKATLQEKKDSARDSWNGFLDAMARDKNEEELGHLKKRMILSFVFLAVQILNQLLLKSGDVLALRVIDGCLVLPLIILNYRCFVDGALSIKRRQPEKNTLAALGSILAIAVLHFTTASVILTMMAICRYIEAYIKFTLNDHLTDLIEGEPGDDGIEKGDVLTILPGEVIPADGVILSGGTNIDEELITGEGAPARKRDGDFAFAGTRNLTSEITMKVTNTGANRVITRIILYISRAIMSKSPVAGRAEKLARRFVLLVIAISIVVAALWYLAEVGLTDAALMGIAVLVIANPYAFSVAVPMTVLAAAVRGSANGILFRSAEILEEARDINTIVINKTGTITAGHPEISDVIPLREDFDLKMAGALEQGARHPYGKTICKAAQAAAGDLPETEFLGGDTGRGIRSRMKGKEYLIGSAAYMRERNVDLTKVKTGDLFRQGKSLVFFAEGNQVIGIIALRDVSKPTSLRAITQIEEMGIDVVMLTGDSTETANAIRREIGIDQVYADILPEEKTGIVKKIRDGSSKIVAAIGDGIEDAAAIEAADLGIAIGTGKDIYVGPADMVLITDDLLDVIRAIRLSRLTARNLKQSIAFAYIYNVIAIIMGAGGFVLFTGVIIAPVAAAVCMCVSQVLVLLNALRIRRARL